MRARWFWVLLWLLLLAPTKESLAEPAPVILEDLQYRVGFGPWEDMARVNLILKKVGPERYLAEFSGAAQGAWQILQRWLPERYETEMALTQEERFQPLVFREVFWSKGEHVVKEYRFDHRQHTLELWRQADGKEKVKKWQVPLKGPVYDPLTMFYNARRGVFGPLLGGATQRLQGIPTPEPVEWIFRVGPETEAGRKVMLTLKEKDQESDTYFIFFTPERVPNLAWARVLLGKLTGTWLNPGGVLRQSPLSVPGPLVPSQGGTG